MTGQPSSKRHVTRDHAKQIEKGDSLDCTHLMTHTTNWNKTVCLTATEDDDDDDETSLKAIVEPCNEWAEKGLAKEKELTVAGVGREAP